MTIQSTLNTSDLPIYTTIPDDASIVLSHTVDFLKNKSNDSILMTEDMEQLIHDYDHIYTLLSKVLQQSYGDKTLIKKKNTVTKYLSDKVYISKVLAQDFLKQDKKQDKRIKWVTVDRPLLAKEFRNCIQMDLDAIFQRANDLHFSYQFDKAFKQQDVTLLQKFMTGSSYLFWSVSIGQDKIDGTWQQFIDVYQLLYGTLEVPMLQAMESLLCETDKKVTVHRFIKTLHKCNNQFPFPDTINSVNASITEVTSTHLNKKPISEEKYMNLTKTALDMVEKFSESKMREHLISIYSWYVGYDKKNKEAMRERANEWGALVKERRALISDNKQELLQAKHEQAERIDQARRAIYFFYEQFVTIWRVGDVTREILKAIDFPGKGRIRDFLNFVAPLDQANFYVVMGLDKNSPKKDYRPKVYDFMEMYLNMLVQQSKERDDYKNQQKQSCKIQPSFLSCTFDFLHNGIEDSFKVKTKIREFKDEVVHLSRAIPKNIVEGTILAVEKQQLSQFIEDSVQINFLLPDPEGSCGSTQYRLRKRFSDMFRHYRNVDKGPLHLSNKIVTKTSPLDSKHAIIWKIIK
ncbi:hypothetical protein BDA99DRAFT_601068 [Phascolomyces articulosus]|uniref:Uncharacterized protein n=1 Tax=Phascolomyces articulosus TaxID=60185 RepID=A0AAD5KM35_9FUNG|nr:hypothetical protein BDA99DRAFT_601068 [Phascolomyces articulosus]